jgi:tetratricopeptide (TPR) repeat protein
VLSGATALQQPMKIALQDAAARWHLEHGAVDVARTLLLEAASGLEQLRRDRTELMLPFVARSLHNLGAQLQGLAQETAIDVTLSAAAAWRQLSRHSGEAFLPELASTLGNLGAMLTLSGCPDDAAALLRKGVSTCWGGMTRESLSVLTSARGLLTRAPTGEAPEGLMLQERASQTLTRIEPYARWQLRALSLAITASDPATPFTATSAQLRPALAETLHNLGAALGRCGQLKPAIEATTVAVAVLQSLPETTIKQAEALSNLSALKSIDGDHEGARGAAEAAVMLLADQDAPAEHAHALSNLSAVLYTLGCHQRAALVAREAADILETPSSTKMMVLFNLGLARAATGSSTEAIAALQAALSLRAPATPPRVLDCFQRLSAEH